VGVPPAIRLPICLGILGGGYFQSFQRGSVKSPWHSRAWYFERGQGRLNRSCKWSVGVPPANQLPFFLGIIWGDFPLFQQVFGGFPWHSTAQGVFGGGGGGLLLLYHGISEETGVYKEFEYVMYLVLFDFV